jgi:hypothetical protein
MSSIMCLVSLLDSSWREDYRQLFSRETWPTPSTSLESTSREDISPSANRWLMFPLSMLESAQSHMFSFPQPLTRELESQVELPRKSRKKEVTMHNVFNNLHCNKFKSPNKDESFFWSSWKTGNQIVRNGGRDERLCNH